MEARDRHDSFFSTVSMFFHTWNASVAFVKEKRVSDWEELFRMFNTTIYYSATLHSTLNVHTSERIYFVCYNYFYSVTLHSTLNVQILNEYILCYSVTSAILRVHTTRMFSMCFHNVFSMKQSSRSFTTLTILHSLQRLHSFSKERVVEWTKK